MKTLKTGSHDIPKPRRRHCGCFVGSCLIIFGGFNGEYFNDLHYINVFELKSKFNGNLSLLSETDVRYKYLNNPDFYDHIVYSTDDKKVYLAKGLIAENFKSLDKIESFLDLIDSSYSE